MSIRRAAARYGHAPLFPMVFQEKLLEIIISTKGHIPVMAGFYLNCVKVPILGRIERMRKYALKLKIQWQKTCSNVIPACDNPRRPRQKNFFPTHQLAAQIVAESVGDDGKNPAAIALGRLGGKKGGKARAEKLTPEQRREIAKKAAATRWGS